MGATAIILAGGQRDKGGIERVVSYYTREMVSLGEGDNVIVLPSRTGSSLLAVHTSPVLSLLKLRRLITAGKVDVVHLNVAPKGSTVRKAIFAKVAAQAGAKVIVHLHGSGYDEFFARQSAAAKAYIAAFFYKADKVVVLSERWKRFALEALRVSEDKVCVISNGVPDPGISSGSSSRVPQIITAGALGERKGTDVLLEALGIIAARDVSFTCALLGGGDLEALRAQADALGLAGHVKFEGWQDEDAVKKAMRQSSVFVLPSRRENQPVAILEAMAMGLPVVATKVGAIPEQVDDGNTGLLVEPNDPAALADALETLLRSPDLRAKLGAASRSRWEQLYSAKGNALALMRVYDELRRK